MVILFIYLLIVTAGGMFLSRVSRLTVRNIGLFMLVLGILPWVYTPLLLRDREMEGSGMLGTLIFLFIGIPGLIWSLIGILRED